MKVLDLRCGHGHGFEGWFASEDDFQSQHERGLVVCPLCSSHAISRMPSAPRLNLGAGAQSAAPEPTAPSPEQAIAQQMWMKAVEHVVRNTEDVGEKFAEEARRIHYGESATRGIRGRASQQESQDLHDEGIDVYTMPMPAGLKSTRH